MRALFAALIPEDATARRRSVLVLVPTLFVLLVSFVGLALVRGKPALIFLDNLHWTVTYAAGAMLAWIGSLAPDVENRRPRRWVAWGFTGYACGQVLWDVQVATGWNPFPGPSDLFFLLLGPGCALGLLSALRAQVAPGQLRTLALDITNLSVAVLTLTLALYLPLRGETSGFELGVMVLYPLGLLVAACVGVVLVPTLRLRADPPWMLFLAALLLNGVLWMRWNTLTLNNALSDGTFYNALFSVAAVGQGLGILSWRVVRSDNRKWDRQCEGFLRLLPLLLAMVMATAVALAWSVPALPTGVKIMVSAGGGIVAALAIARQSLALQDRDRLRALEREALEKEVQFKTLFESASDAIFLLRDGAVADCNPSAAAMFGCRREELAGQLLLAAAPEFQPDGARSADAVAGRMQAAEGGEPQAFEWVHRRRDGGEFSAEVRLNRVAEGDPLFLQAIVRDITARKQVEALNAGQQQVLELIARNAPLGETLTALVRVIEAQGDGMICSILLLDAEGLHLHHGAAPQLPDAYVRAIDGVTIGPCVGSCGTAAYRRETVIVTDLATDPLWADYRGLALAHGLRACWSTPIFDTERHVLGTFAVYYRRPARPAPGHFRLIESATHTAAIALAHHRTAAALRESEERFRAALEFLPTPIAITEPDFTVRYLNRAFTERYGFARADIPDLATWAARAFPDGRERSRCQEQWRQDLTSAGELSEATPLRFYRMATKSGPFREVEMTTRSVGRWCVTALNDITERREAEAAVQKRLVLERQLASVADDVPGAMFAFEILEDGLLRIPYASLKLAEVAGVTPAEVAADAAPFFARVHLEDRAFVQKSIRAVAGSVAPWEAVFRVLHPVKGLTWIEGRSHPVPQPDGGFVWHGFLFDITERRLGERRRAIEHAVAQVLASAQSVGQAAEAILQAIGEAEGWQFGALWLLDDTGGTLTCAEVWHEPGAALAAFGQASRRLALAPGMGLPGRVLASGKPTIGGRPGADAECLRAREAVAAGLHGALGFPVRAGGRVTGVVEFLSRAPIAAGPPLEDSLGALGSQLGQFIARKTAQEELRRFVALNPAVLYALRLTPAGPRCTWASENFSQLTGYPMDAAFQPGWWLANLHPEDRERAVEADLLGRGLDQQVLEFRFRRQDGTYIWVRDEKRLLRNGGGEPREIVGAWLDITGRVKLEKQLRQAQKMEAIGLLSGGIAHDFNNLLGAILGNAQLASLDIGPDHPAAQSLEEVTLASRRAASLVRQILTFARRDSQELRLVDLGPIAEESVRLLRATIPAGIELESRLAAGLPRVAADETQVQQVILNLGTNAWHAMAGPAGRIGVELAPVEVGADLAAQNPDLQPGPYLRLRVQDNGRGMDAATVERIFDPFYTTKGPGKGTGLGLSVVHGIMKSHRGAISVQSAPGTGTTFDLYFPTQAGPVAEAPEADLRFQLGRGEEILLLDDEPSLLAATKRLLERLGYGVTACADPHAALATFRADPERFTLVLTDLNMPGLTGLEVARRLRQLQPRVSVVLASGFITDDVRQAVEDSGLNGIIRKPSSLEELGETLHRCLRPGAAAMQPEPVRDSRGGSPARPEPGNGS